MNSVPRQYNRVLKLNLNIQDYTAQYMRWQADGSFLQCKPPSWLVSWLVVKQVPFIEGARDVTGERAVLRCPLVIGPSFNDSSKQLQVKGPLHSGHYCTAPDHTVQYCTYWSLVHRHLKNARTRLGNLARCRHLCSPRIQHRGLVCPLSFSAAFSSWWVSRVMQ